MAIWRLGDSFERGSGIMLVEVLTDAGDWKVCDAVPEDAESIVRDHNAALSQQPRSEGGDALRALLREIATPNDNGYTRCRGCGGFWHTEGSPVHLPQCRVAEALASTQRPADGGGRDG